jgi:mannose/fructose/N-acetylgalactosamine-specific phosphotransferase system component IIC
VPSDTVRLYFQFATSATKFRRYPDSILTGLQKFGGLLGLFKFSILLTYLHKKRFEKKLMAKMRKPVDVTK